MENIDFKNILNNAINNIKNFDFRNIKIKKIEWNRKNIMSLIGILLMLASALIIATSFFSKKYFAFDGAEGFGAYTEGGRHGIAYHVTSLEDSNTEGTLRYAIEQQGARTIIFDVSGIIDLKSPLVINEGSITIAGQTAPGDGICLRGNGIVINSNNVIIRFIRIRPGNTSPEVPALEINDAKNIIVDHCSISWAKGGNIKLKHVENSTFQWNFINETLGDFAVDFTGKNKNISIHHNLFANNHETNINFNPGYVNKKIDIRNNVFFNWDVNTISNPGIGEYNIVNNYYKFSSNTEKNNKNQIITTLYSPIVSDIIYANGNEIYLAPIISSNNIAGIYPNVEFLQTSKNSYITKKEFYHASISTHSGVKIQKMVLDYAGASLKRDYPDLKILKDMTNSSFLKLDLFVNFGIYPEYNSDYTYADIDNDGMRDDWELKHNLNPLDPLDAYEKDKHNRNFTNRDIYLDSFVSDITKKQLENTTFCQDTVRVQLNKFLSKIKR
ncbi:hypothetical protein IJ732_00660 [bacterium]|nr:hypothetical protein [bacterium]